MSVVKKIVAKAKDARRMIARLDPSPMNPRVKLAELECGHEMWLRPPFRARVGAKVVCPTCFQADRA